MTIPTDKLADLLEQASPELRDQVRSRLPKKTGLLRDDGCIRHEDDQRKVDLMFARIFRGRDGDLALGYLRSLTCDRVTGPHEADCAVRHLEGQRYLYAVIERAVKRGRKRG